MMPSADIARWFDVFGFDLTLQLSQIDYIELTPFYPVMPLTLPKLHLEPQWDYLN